MGGPTGPSLAGLGHAANQRERQWTSPGQWTGCCFLRRGEGPPGCGGRPGPPQQQPGDGHCFFSGGGQDKRNCSKSSSGRIIGTFWRARVRVWPLGLLCWGWHRRPLTHILQGRGLRDGGYEKPQAIWSCCFLVLLPWMGEATQPVPVPLIPAMAHTPAIPSRRTTPCHSSTAMGTGAVLRVSCSLSHGQGRVGQGHGHRAVPQGGSEEF